MPERTPRLRGSPYGISVTVPEIPTVSFVEKRDTRKDCPAPDIGRTGVLIEYPASRGTAGREIEVRIVSLTSFILMVIGALNWLLVGVARFDLVRRLFGRNSPISRIVYDLVGVAGLVQLTTFALRTARGRPYPAAS